MLILLKASGFMRMISDCFRKLESILLFFILGRKLVLVVYTIENPLLPPCGDRSTETSNLSVILG